ncbi:hypothetical protein A3I25_00940 [Candidatus Nomurabacteria bacterium RIFCSPLOWO2_02_FULL_42_17]|uniref:DUF4446 domain-containing protein n=2 Tax=Candidatus Nomuraibacteriota TaxID=1752729 RepID=A0A1F6WG34_9BACT|nr:MAG: hypothetical protein A3B93_01245 [Candidatus Nomurabacteria bacterium RIFCSPHIGHO2_02_FULL_42_24]OGI96879.1 MAG: hypothetical protein A3I25_00940 [Candidatus Nomurabacteria bacterium RIFCSPLOWO2_02_FULL_42_17]
MATDTLIYILLGAVAILVAHAIWAELRLRRIFAGSGAKNLENIIADLVRDLKNLEKSHAGAQKDIAGIESRLKTSLRGFQIVRFNPFRDSGGNQSFAVALLNEEGDGVVLSSLYARERVSIFAKPVKNNTSPYDLTAEEKEALEKAKVK